MPSASLPTTVLNDMKPGKEGKNVFLYCGKQEITHEPRSTQQKKQELHLISAVETAARRVPRAQHPFMLPYPGEKLLSFCSYCPHPGRVAPSLENRAAFLNLFVKLSWSHLPVFWLLLGWNHISASSSPARPQSHTTSCECKSGFIYPRTQCPCAAEAKHGIILLASNAVCIYWGVYL